MLNFYKNITLVFFALAVCTLLLAWFCFERVFVRDSLLPATESALPWTLETNTDVQINGSSSALVRDSTYSLDYQYLLTEDKKFPYVSQFIKFVDSNQVETLVDLNAYSSINFKVKCTPRNVLTFYLHSFDERVTKLDEPSTYRISSRIFSCEETWSELEIDLRYLNVSIWWLESFDIEVSDQSYALDKVRAISFDASRKGPVNTQAKVEISELALQGKKWHYALIFAAVSLCIWVCFIVWLFKLYTRSLIEEVKNKLRKDLPLIAYQQLSIEPHKDEEKNQVLRFMATQYANPELSVDLAIHELGINRIRINEILKKELGFTFNIYMNKLRLAEAARLLSAKKDANIAEIAFSVGYNNVSYFNKLFKSEYGCTPKIFKNLSHAGEQHR